jgi:8-oxo-dGTP diphosphatase
MGLRCSERSRIAARMTHYNLSVTDIPQQLPAPVPPSTLALMDYAISAGALIVRGGRLLLVHHRGKGFDFWLPPGGRLEGEESIFDCAARETCEETGLPVLPLRAVYIEEFIEADLHFCKLWLLAREEAGELCLPSPGAVDPHVVDARFVSQSELEDLDVFPGVLRDTFWQDLERGFPETRYLGLQRIEAG